MARSNGGDLIRAIAVLLTALLQIAAGAAGGTGLLTDQPVGEVARSQPNPLLPSGAAFMIWNLVYVAVLALAVWQLLPSQRGTAVHRRTGWLIAVSGVLNIAWVALFTAERMLAAQIVIVALLVVLAFAWARSGVGEGNRSERRARRWLLWGVLALYTGWVTMATVVGALTTLAELTGEAPGTAVALAALAVTTAAIVWTVARAGAVVAFTASVLWALTWIAVNAEATVTFAGAAAALLIAAAFALRLVKSADRMRAAFG